MFSDDDGRWMDENLREVRVPRELIARLKAAHEDHDSILESALNATPLPHRLLSKLKLIPENARLDSDICAVAIPASLLENAKQIPAAVNVLAGPPRSVPTAASDWGESGRRQTTGWLAVAAAVLLVGGAVYLSSFSTRGVDRQRAEREPRRDRDRENVIASSPADATNGANTATDEDVLVDNEADDPTALADSTSPVEQPTEPGTRAIPDDLELAEAGANLEMTRLGMPGRIAPPPKLRHAASPSRRGIAPPAIREYDLLSLARTGVHPFVFPSDNVALQSISVPLVTGAASFDSAVAAVRAGSRPDPSRIRTEEFLAAVGGAAGLENPDASQSLSTSIAGGPSPWSKSNRFLLKIDVAAHGAPSHGDGPVVEDARLKVTFRSEAIRSYRLLGHEADAGGGLLPDSVKKQLNSGDVSTVVFEVELQATGGDDVGSVHVSWRDPNGGAFHEYTRRVRRGHLAPTFAESLPSVQLAALALAAAELLRGSPYVGDGYSARDAINLTDQANPALYSNRRFNELVELFEFIE